MEKTKYLLWSLCTQETQAGPKVKILQENFSTLRCIVTKGITLSQVGEEIYPTVPRYEYKIEFRAIMTGSELITNDWHLLATDFYYLLKLFMTIKPVPSLYVVDRKIPMITCVSFYWRD